MKDKQKIPKSYDTYDLDKEEKQKYTILFAVALFIIAYIFYKSLVISACITVFSPYCLKFYAKYMCQKRKDELTLQFKDALYSISSSVAANRQIPEAIKDACGHMQMIHGADSYIATEFMNMTKRIHESKESEEHVLSEFAQRANIDDIWNFYDVYITCKETGGDLEKVLTKTTKVIMEKISIYAEIKTQTAQKKLEAKILALMPIIATLFLQVCSPDYISVMYETFLGRCIMTSALLGIVIAYLLSMKITDIKI